MLRKTICKIFVVIVAFFLLLCLYSVVYAEDKLSEEEKPVSLYKRNYFIVGDEKNQIKFQFSAKYAIFTPSEISFFYPFDAGLYFAYTHQAWWGNREKSRPMKEQHYNPELFIKSSGKHKWYQIGLIEHKSNGLGGHESRGWNRSYIQFNLEHHETQQKNFGLNIKLFWLYGVSGGCTENREIEKKGIDEMGVGFLEAEVYYYFKNSADIEVFKIYAKFGAGASETFKYREYRRFWFVKKGWIEGGVMAKIPRSNVWAYAQLYYGYNEWLQWYDQKTCNVRIGVMYK